MENYAYSSDSSPRSREIDCDNSVASWDNEQATQPAAPPAAGANAGRVKLMISYGGRIQPRPHDNQLSYVGGDTKILAVDRHARFSALYVRLAALVPNADEVCVKYQLPGEDLDALISLTNDEDLEHMMLEYDRLLRCAKPSPRLRVFLFPINPPPPSAHLLDHTHSINNKPVAAAAAAADRDRHWFVDAGFNSVPPMVEGKAAAFQSPDFLFGLDKGFVPPPEVKVKDPAPDPPSPAAVLEGMQAKAADQGKEEQSGQIGDSEIQRQAQEIQRLQIAENQSQQQQGLPAGMPRNGSEETLASRVYATEYYVPPPQAARVQEKAPPVPASATAYWPEQRVAQPGGYASVAGGDQAVYLVPAAAMGQGYYVQRMVPPDVYRDAAGAAVYAVPPPPQTAAANVMGQYSEVSSAGGGVVRAAQAAVSGGGAGGYGAQVAYDSSGRAVYYTSAMPSYPTVTSVVLNPESKAVKPPQPQVS